MKLVVLSQTEVAAQEHNKTITVAAADTLCCVCCGHLSESQYLPRRARLCCGDTRDCGQQPGLRVARRDCAPQLVTGQSKSKLARMSHHHEGGII